MMNCENCQATFSDPEGTYIAHGCPNCGYRGQPTPIKDEMTHGLDAMPTSTMDDMSGNPLQEGILGDGGWQNRNVRDESYASVRTANHAFLINEDGKVFSQEHPATHEDIAATLGDKQRHLQTGAKGVILPNGYYQVHDNGSVHSPEVIDTTLRHHFGDHIMKSTSRQTSDQDGYLPYWYEKTADKETFDAQKSLGNDGDPEHADTKEINDGDHDHWQKDLDVSEGGTDNPDEGQPDFDPEGEGMKAFKALLPLLEQLADSEESGENHPMVMELHKLLDQELPGYLGGPDEDEHHHAAVKESILPLAVPAAAAGARALIPRVAPLAGQAVKGLMKKVFQKGPSGLGKAVRNQAIIQGVKSVIPEGKPEEQAVVPVRDAFMMSNVHTAEFGVGVPNPGSVPNAGQQFPTPNRTTQSKCSGCGSTIDPSMPVCPQCGAPAQVLPGQAMNRPASVTAASHQGPHTPEQIAAVQQMLINEGRVGEIPDVPLHPELYADEMAKIQQIEPPPADVTNESPPPPPPPPMPPEGGPPGQNMPMPGMSMNQSLSRVLEKYAADNIAKDCPKCHSHTTSLVTEDGSCRCHNCGNIWEEGAVQKVVQTSKTAVHEFENIEGLSAAEQDRPEDVNSELDTSHSWTDKSGEELKAGMQYKVYSEKYSIPDIIRVLKVRPNSIQIEETGAYGLGFKHEITNDEKQLDGMQFEAITDADPSTGPTDTDSAHVDPRAGVAPGETSDLSTPHTTLSNLALDWLRDESDMSRTAGASYTRTEQRDLIDEKGKARNSDKMNLSRTHYRIDEDDDDSFLFGM